MKRAASLFAAALLLCALPAAAQDPTVVDSDHYKVAHEDDHVRVLRITYGPGEKSVMHGHPEAIAIALTDARMMMHGPDGEAVEMTMTAGDVGPTPAETHMPENVGDAPVEVILVEFKHHGMEHDEEHDHDME